MTNQKQTDESSARAATPQHRHEPWWRYLLKYGVPLIITVGLCYLLFIGVDFNEMAAIIRDNCNYWWILLALVISIFSHIFRAMRWRIQLRAVGVRPPLFNLVLSIFGCYAVNLVLPRLGELWRTYYISQRQDAPFSTVFGSMVADRLADTLTVLLLCGITFLAAGHQLHTYLMQNTESYEKLVELLLSPWLWVAVAAVIAAIVVIQIRFPHNRVVMKVKSFLIGIWQGFAVVATMPGRGRWLLLTVAIWGCYFTQLYVAFFSFPLTAEVVHTYGATAVLVCFMFSSLSMGVPSNGGIGPWQWAVIFGLSLYAVPGLTKGYATSFANLVMGSQTLLLILLGIFTFICIAVQKRHGSAAKPQLHKQ